MKSFESLGLSAELLQVIKHKGFESPTLIQEKAIPALLSGTKDLIGQAQTGTGKTAAFGLPILERITEHSRHVQALILTPTRELSIQVAEEINSLKGKKKVSIVPIYGGQSIDQQLRSLRRGVDIVVGTPGRILDHLRRRSVNFDHIAYLVLDEADEMLNMGFLEEVRDILKQTKSDKRTMLFSATMPPEIVQIAKQYMRDYEIVKANTGQLTVSQTDQIYFEVAAADKFEALCRIIDIEEEFYGLIFCRTKIDVDSVAAHLNERGYDADGLHGDLSQSQREKILSKFKKRVITVLVATDVAARGIDVRDISHVINYALPQDSESYIHRIGRTGRAGKTGNAITFITPSEYRKLQYIQKGARTDIRKATLPNVRDLIATKKKRIKNSVSEIIEDSVQGEYRTLAQELMACHAPEDVLAALLQYSFQDELTESSYAEIETKRVDRKGTTRLFVRGGKKDGLTPNNLIAVMKDKCAIDRRSVRDIQIFDKFSFVTLPFHEAEIVLAYFKKQHRGGGLYITAADKGRDKKRQR